MAGRPKSRARAKANRAVVGVASPDALERLEKALVECAVDPRTARQLVTRLEGRPLSPEGRLKLDDAELLSLIDDKLARAFQNLDDFALGSSNARDLATNIGILIDKRKLLKPGDDSPVRRFQDMRKMDDVLEAMCKEMIRRGILVEVAPAAAEPTKNAGNGGMS